MSITPAEVKAARALLGWSQKELAKRVGISGSFLSGFEGRLATPSPATLRHTESVLESAGVEFIAENGGGVGVRLSKGK